MPQAWWIILSAGVLAAIAVFVWWPVRAAVRDARFVRARRHFHTQRERLEAKFVHLVSTGTRSSSRWADCDFDDDVAYVRHRSTGELSAFVAVTVSTEEAGEVPSSSGEAVGNLRAGTAVFRFDRDHWETDGRAIFNLTPAEAIRAYHDDLEVIEQELARRS